MDRIRPFDPDEVICPNCGHTFRAVPATAQEIHARQREEIITLRTSKMIVERSNRILCDLAEALIGISQTSPWVRSAEEIQTVESLAAAILRTRAGFTA